VIQLTLRMRILEAMASINSLTGIDDLAWIGCAALPADPFRG